MIGVYQGTASGNLVADPQNEIALRDGVRSHRTNGRAQIDLDHTLVLADGARIELRAGMLLQPLVGEHVEGQGVDLLRSLGLLYPGRIIATSDAGKNGQRFPAGLLQGHRWKRADGDPALLAVWLARVQNTPGLVSRRCDAEDQSLHLAIAKLLPLVRRPQSFDLTGTRDPLLHGRETPLS